jgi:hypothetical protein
VNQQFVAAAVAIKQVDLIAPGTATFQVKFQDVDPTRVLQLLQVLDVNIVLPITEKDRAIRNPEPAITDHILPVALV